MYRCCKSKAQSASKAKSIETGFDNEGGEPSFGKDHWGRMQLDAVDV